MPATWISAPPEKRAYWSIFGGPQRRSRFGSFALCPTNVIMSSTTYGVKPHPGPLPGLLVTRRPKPERPYKRLRPNSETYLDALGDRSGESTRLFATTLTPLKV